MINWTVECFIKERVAVSLTFDNEKEAKEEFEAFCFDNKISHEKPGPGMTLYDTIEFFKQNTVTGEILERKVRQFK